MFLRFEFQCFSFRLPSECDASNTFECDANQANKKNYVVNLTTLFQDNTESTSNITGN